MPKGFVYIFSNPAMPGLLKIGYTGRIPTDRANELSSTGVPVPFEVEYYCIVEEASDIETQVHAHLAVVRRSADREFFRVSVREAIEAIEKLAPNREHT